MQHQKALCQERYENNNNAVFKYGMIAVDKPGLLIVTSQGRKSLIHTQLFIEKPFPSFDWIIKLLSFIDCRHLRVSTASPQFILQFHHEIGIINVNYIKCLTKLQGTKGWTSHYHINYLHILHILNSSQKRIFKSSLISSSINFGCNPS